MPQPTMRELIDLLAAQEAERGGATPKPGGAGPSRDPASGYIKSHRYGSNSPDELAAYYMQQLTGMQPPERMMRAADTETRRMDKQDIGPSVRRRRNAPRTAPSEPGVNGFASQPSGSRRGRGGGGMEDEGAEGPRPSTEEEFETIHNAMGSSGSDMATTGAEPTEDELVALQDRVANDQPLRPRDKEVLYWLRENGMNPSAQSAGELTDVPASNPNARTSMARRSASR